MSSEMERGETESYLDLELTELDDLFHMNGGILTFQVPILNQQIDGKTGNQTNDLKFFTYMNLCFGDLR